MGGLVSAPLAIGAQCCGGLMASCCCQLAMSGSTATARSARCVLLWLQIFGAALALLLTINPSSWLSMPCAHLSGVGICECSDGPEEETCWGNQLIYRAEASVTVVFCFLLILCVSGCATAAAKSFPVGKFLAVIVLLVVSLFLPNEIMSGFGAAAGFISAAYLVAQSVVIIGFAYDLNEKMHKQALTTLRREIGQRGYKMWLAAIIVSSVLMLIAAVVGCILLYMDFPIGGARALVITLLVLSLVFLFVSILEWCEHGSLLASSLMAAYSMWLSYEALSTIAPGDDFSPHLLPRWIEMAVCALSLLAFSQSSGLSLQGGQQKDEVQDGPLTGGTDHAGDTAAAAAEGEDLPAGLDKWEFTVQCAVHAGAALYITSSMAPARSTVTFVARVLAAVVSVLLYGWSLVAPKVLTSRRFA